ncbi:unnamed protein product [Litomosoides sigmodontis]|uniref:peptidylprolyl isomerase n=1 Tax=Litomosoides sigmodontis TaxID=42156 RepID=A0A3P6T1G5_LITSI|nr:unnamed protein product [Litomosoides sigmodontis]
MDFYKRADYDIDGVWSKGWLKTGQDECQTGGEFSPLCAILYQIEILCDYSFTEFRFSDQTPSRLLHAWNLAPNTSKIRALVVNCCSNGVKGRQFPNSMFSLIWKVRHICLAKVTPAIRCYAAVKTAGSYGNVKRLPAGFGKTTPLSLFIKENFASRKNEQPTEVFSKLTKQWKSLDEANKKKYIDEASRISEERRTKFQLMSETEKEELRKRSKDLKEARLKRRIRLERRKKRESDGQRSMSGWMLFVKEKAVKGAANTGKRQQDIIKELAMAWKSLSKSDKDICFYIENLQVCHFRIVPKPDEVIDTCQMFSTNEKSAYKFMKCSVILIPLVLVAVCCDDRELARLQIGVKKRIDNCDIRSRKGDTLNVHYVGMLENGTEFDNSRSRNRPFIFTLGMGQVIKGWDQGLLNMCEGEQRRLAIPSDLAYGSFGSPPKIPPDASLKFDIELLKIERERDL